MPHNSVADGFHTKNTEADILPENCNFRWKMAASCLWATPGGDVHL